MGESCGEAQIALHENAVEPIIGERLPTAVPDKTFTKDLTLELGGEGVELTRVAPSHSNSMIMIHFPKHSRQPFLAYARHPASAARRSAARAPRAPLTS